MGRFSGGEIIFGFFLFLIYFTRKNPAKQIIKIIIAAKKPFLLNASKTDAKKNSFLPSTFNLKGIFSPGLTLKLERSKGIAETERLVVFLPFSLAKISIFTSLFSPASNLKLSGVIFIQSFKSSGKTLKIPASFEIFAPQGCQKCGSTGYSGRIAVFEILSMTDSLAEIILKEPSEVSILEEAKRQGMITMKQDGILKVLRGVTTIEEILRVAEEK